MVLDISLDFNRNGMRSYFYFVIRYERTMNIWKMNSLEPVKWKRVIERKKEAHP